MYVYDTETCGFKGPAVLIQYAGLGPDDPIHMHSIWTSPIEETLDLIRELMDKGTMGFNLTFDQFQLTKIYSMLDNAHMVGLSPGDSPASLVLDPLDIDTKLLHQWEKNSRECFCLKPRHAFDVMLHARKTEYQMTMERKDIIIKRVPTALARPLVQELEARIELNSILFARAKSRKEEHWVIDDVTDADGDVNTDFKNICLRFKPSVALKALAVEALGVPAKDVVKFDRAGVDKSLNPKEDNYVPYGSNWPDVIRHHITHWAYNSLARKYATNDVVFTRDLYRHFGEPPVDDTDSVLACMVGNIRWRGYEVDTAVLERRCAEAKMKADQAPKAPAQARYHVEQFMTPLESLVIRRGTGKVILEEIARWVDEDGNKKPAAIAASQVLEARTSAKEVELYEKIIKAGRFHASFKVIGALSGRMSGADGLNPQGIKKDKAIRKAFTLAPPSMVLCGGDFDAFEVSIAEAEYNDPDLRTTLLSGKKIHALFALQLYPFVDSADTNTPVSPNHERATPNTYENVMLHSGEHSDRFMNGSMYKDGKTGIFGMIYGGTDYTLVQKLGVSEEVAQAAFNGFSNQYKGIAESQRRIYEDFCSMRQPGGIGSQVTWAEPKDYVESMFGFRRWFQLENRICRALYELACSPPKAWTKLKIKVQRRDREQTASGAVRSALYAAAFGIQGANMRAATNHVIQSSGATITKELQHRLWDLQPVGVEQFHVMPMNVHDEVLCPTLPALAPKTAEICDAIVEKYKATIPLIDISWSTNMGSWAG